MYICIYIYHNVLKYDNTLFTLISRLKYWFIFVTLAISIYKDVVFTLSIERYSFNRKNTSVTSLSNEKNNFVASIGNDFATKLHYLKVLCEILKIAKLYPGQTLYGTLRGKGFGMYRNGINLVPPLGILGTTESVSLTIFYRDLTSWSIAFCFRASKLW